MNPQTHKVNEELIAIQTNLHNQWLSELFTQNIIKIIGLRRNQLVSKLAAAADNTAIPDSSIRQLAIKITETDRILEVITKPELAVAYVIKNTEAINKVE